MLIKALLVVGALMLAGFFVVIISTLHRQDRQRQQARMDAHDEKEHMK